MSSDCCSSGLLYGLVPLAILAYGMLQKWMQGGSCHSKARLDCRTVVITGANTGIGKETAMDLSRRGANIVILCRNVKKGEEAAEEIRKHTKGQVVVHEMDLSSLTSVRKCAATLNKTLEKIDILINNAGVMLTPEMRTDEGFELQIGTNHFGHFLLTNLLLPLLRKAGHGARIVVVSSLAHGTGKIHWDDINFKTTPYNSYSAYCQSKLANILFAKELARREEHINVYSLHPGVVNTELFRHVKGKKTVMSYIMAMIGPLYRPFMKDSKQGAQTSIFCAVDESVGGQSGLYYSDCKEKAPKPQAGRMEDAGRLWTLSQKLTGLLE